MKFLATLVIAASLLLAEIPLRGKDQPQDQTPPSTQTAPPEQAAPVTPPPAAPPPAATEPSPDPQTQAPAPAAAPSPAPKSAKKKSRTKPSSPARKVVVRNGGAKDTSAQLAPGISKEQELRSRAITSQLLATTDANVRSVAGRQLTTAQQGLLDQIHTYMRQSKAASDSGDLARAHTLAYKAHLLSDELRK